MDFNEQLAIIERVRTMRREGAIDQDPRIAELKEELAATASYDDLLALVEGLVIELVYLTNRG